VVRIEAGRLRRALDHYYLIPGLADPVIIDVPKGGYVPRFTLRAGQELAAMDPASPCLSTAGGPGHRTIPAA